ncbi:uncharacterized protein LOC126746304 isoform X2 [Anthonomus grandis grandis]|uniref:uncharacterized protein LOC126746304 isoform X2 n=1 Tax=Anthonomus grandis grandis TaxID=2921223 RepID=UPI0021653FDB|nr:uncharacterized protein LOC126746304 isoform X2 [Anthonomus grandis grandis]
MEKKFIVCREFFMATLNVTDALMRSSLQKQTSRGVLEKDRRGKHTPSHKLSAEVDAFIREHILSFPSVESHYCRKSNDRRYSDASLNISVMYRMYKDVCRAKNVKTVTLEKYRSIFREYKLSFFVPKKDQCKTCLAQKNISEEDKYEKEATFKRHLEKKEAARKVRDDDKATAKENPHILAFNFDLQAVLTTPKDSAGQIFYLRKLAVYNLTIYNLANQDVRCYVWNETQAVRMMSDSCGGQQKNSIFAAMCLQLCANHSTLLTVDHQLFETGHTEIECDSIHSKIERKAKHIPVYTADGWAQVIRDLRISPQPFVVKNFMFDDFLDFKTFSVDSYCFSKIPWRNVCSLHYEKGEPSKISNRTNFAEEYKHVDCSKPISNRGRPKQSLLHRAYQQSLPISVSKYKDLEKMCKDYTIPKIHHGFYNSLKTSKDVRDNLPAPDQGESDVTDSE